jgi:hypothetical protein
VGAAHRRDYSWGARESNPKSNINRRTRIVRAFGNADFTDQSSKEIFSNTEDLSVTMV